MQHAPQGADPVNDDVEVGFDARFEHSWSIAERVGRIFMVLFVLAAGAGLLGRGPFSHRTASAPFSGMAVDYEPVARVNTSTQITFHINNDTPLDTVDVFVSTQLVEPMGLERILPQPIAEHIAGDGLRLTFAMPHGTHDGHVRLVVEPGGIGIIGEHAQLGTNPPVHWTQVVVP
jgi:hypothetical protein